MPRREASEKDQCAILSQTAYWIDPKIIAKIQLKNRQEFNLFKEICGNKIDVSDYLYPGSACVFPGVRRYVGARSKLNGRIRFYNEIDRGIIDHDEFPRHIWCYLKIGRSYNGPNWIKSGLNEFELAHVFSHKSSEMHFEKRFFRETLDTLLPYGDFSCACNVVLLPKGTAKPSDDPGPIKATFYQRYVDLYGETTLNGRCGFNSSLVPDWYEDLAWRLPYLPADWENKIDALLEYRTRRITALLNL